MDSQRRLAAKVDSGDFNDPAKAIIQQAIYGARAGAIEEAADLTKGLITEESRKAKITKAAAKCIRTTSIVTAQTRVDQPAIPHHFMFLAGGRHGAW